MVTYLFLTSVFLINFKLFNFFVEIYCEVAKLVYVKFALSEVFTKISLINVVTYSAIFYFLTSFILSLQLGPS